MWKFLYEWPISWTGFKQVKIFIKRLESTDHGIFGHLTIDSGPFNCVTLERHDIAIPTGTYKTVTYFSDHFARNVLLLQDVPGRNYIEIHYGNYETDSKGCILVGTRRDGFAIDSSREAFDGLMNEVKDCNEITVTID